MRLSDRPSDRAVNLLICFDTDMAHYMLITDPKELFKKLICPHCSAVLKRLQDYKKHVSKCEEGRARHVYPGGFHKQPLGIREKLESVGIKMPQDLAYYSEFICYDFEAMFKNISVQTEKTEYFSKHCPVSYVLCDSLGETLSHCDEDPKKLIVSFLRNLLILRKKLVYYMTEDFRGVFNELNEILMESYEEVKYLEDHDPCEAVDKEHNPIDYRMAELQKKWAKQWYESIAMVKSDLVKYIKTVPVLGYNSAHYDINLIKQYMVTLLLEDKKNEIPPFLTEENQVEDLYPEGFEVYEGIQYPEYKAEVRDFAEVSVIKQGGSYTQFIVGKKLRFLDVYKYQSPNTSLDDFLKTYKAPVSKGVFPYEYLTPDTLYSRDIPEIKDFYSSLKRKNMLGDTEEEQINNYNDKVVKVWREENIENLSEYLLYYNRLDVVPFALFITQWLKNFHLFNEDGSVNTTGGRRPKNYHRDSRRCKTAHV